MSSTTSLQPTQNKFCSNTNPNDRLGLKVARTIADLDGSVQVRQPHIMEAIGYRNLDRSNYFNL